MAGKSEYRNTWIAEKLDRINLTVPKGQKDTIKAHAETRSESVNGFINRAISETMERDKAAPGAAGEAGKPDIATHT
ncbi:ABC transporter ATP-binding protein [Intestinimonas butyriciproducens]|uniref:ABC transporter ATP-binding protein n=1 Tax=Intestinimonas butyriciproducens TaxID=1297617 RepID=UPI00242F7F6A|nr:ABC transporter ATP-binding protein [Intestinimonas butyriciproducens]MCI6363115.1 ABC transporter ATP-binding protein [Intestinimonas butyriciproducens]MDY3616134.1 ABC transporter ATP-binding protein [Intestinimonas butyriciproducens]